MDTREGLTRIGRFQVADKIFIGCGLIWALLENEQRKAESLQLIAH